MSNTNTNNYDAIVIGAGHAGVEASLAMARMGLKTLVVTLSLDSISFMACNPSIGGTAKGHLVREIDALGGQMGLNADRNLLQLRMLNMGKGEAVHSLRGQADKTLYHLSMKSTLESQPNLTILQGEVKEILTENGAIVGITTTLGQKFSCRGVVIACGVFLNSKIIIGDFNQEVGPNNFTRATFLSNALEKLEIPLRRFKTGTPARVDSNTIDFSVMESQHGDDKIYPFSFMTNGYIDNIKPCYLTYTTNRTKEIIMSNLDKSPLYNGTIKSVGPRYCPSIEDKIVRFSEKERHQIFIEPESSFTNEMYVQGMSTSMPFDIQLQMYRSVIGLENCKILRYAYAIEYDCLDSLCLDSTLKVKHIEGLYTAGQINGSSGYEEAAAQGLVAGINCGLFIQGKPAMRLTRENSYIGVLIDDLVTKGTNEPYRMMTARAENRLHLRQENADQRLTPIGREVGLVDDERWTKYNNHLDNISKALVAIEKSIAPKDYSSYFEKIDEKVAHNGLTYKEMLRRTNVTAENLQQAFDELSSLDLRALKEIATTLKYAGYLTKQKSLIDEATRLECKVLAEDIDYNSIGGLRLEARQKLSKIRPSNVGQASRISGVSPADITVLLVWLSKRN